MRFGVTGEVSRDRLSQPGMGTWQGLGGCAVYLTLALARLGAEVTFATTIGDDLDPAWLKPLHEARVDLHLRRLAGRTAHLELAYDEKGDIARLRFEAGVESRMDAGQLPAELWAADWMLIGTGPRTYQASVIRQADRRGQAVGLSTQREFQGDWDSLAELLPHLGVLFINSGEVVDLRGDPLPVGMEALRAVKPDLMCVVTCGARGAFLLHEHWLYQTIACPSSIVNTTGAGDAFGAAWLYTFTDTEDAAYALRAASAAASLAMEGPAHTSLPDAAQIQARLKAWGASLPVHRWSLASSQAQAALSGEDAYCHRALDRRVRRS